MTRAQREQKRFFYHARKQTERQINKETSLLFREMFLDLYKSFQVVREYRTRVDEYDLNLLLTLICIGILWAGNNVSDIETALANNITKIRWYLGLSEKKCPEFRRTLLC